jgi:hypothetical protein
MYSSAIAPSRHFATVTMRLPSANSPITQVQSPDPKAMGCEESWGGVPPTESTKAVTRRQPALPYVGISRRAPSPGLHLHQGHALWHLFGWGPRSGVRTQHSSSAAAQARKHPVQPPRVQAAHRLQSSTSPHWRRCWQRRGSDCVHSNLLSVPSVLRFDRVTLGVPSIASVAAKPCRNSPE